MSLRQTRNRILEIVAWDQSAILKAISDIARRLGLPVSSTEPVRANARALTVRGTDTHEVISSLSDITAVLERIELQLSYITEEPAGE